MRKDYASTKQKTLVSVMGLYSSFQDLRDGTHHLRRLGFNEQDFSLLFSELAVTPQGQTLSELAFSRSGPDCPLIGGTFEFLLYLGGWEEGVIAGAIMSLGVPEYEAEEYEAGICHGQLLLCVRATSSAFADLAMQIFLRSGAQSILAVPESCCVSKLKTDKSCIWFESPSSLGARLVC